MLSLASTTGRAWIERACAHLDEILLDHAHCEKKAASTAVSLLFKYAERRELPVTLSQLAREELGHFEQVLAELAARGVAFRHQVPSPYAGQPALASLYRGLLAAEARHHETYVELATAVAPDARVRTRLRELALHEAAVLASAPPIARLHA